MCKQLDLDVKKSTNSKKAQFKELARYCKYSKIGQKIIIEEVFETVHDKVDLRGKSKPKLEPLKYTDPYLYEHIIKNSSSIDYENLTRGSKKEITLTCEHCHKEYITTVVRASNKKTITCGECSMSDGERYIYRYLKSHNLKFIKEITFDELISKKGRKLRFDFAIFKDNDLKGIIEFDGHFHYKEYCKDDDNFELRTYYDDLKNQYCIDNDIPLKRISFKNLDKAEISLCKFLSEIGFNQFYKRYIELITEEKVRILNKINKLHNELKILNEL